jgi:hypothetical protein
MAIGNGWLSITLVIYTPPVTDIRLAEVDIKGA